MRLNTRDLEARALRLDELAHCPARFERLPTTSEQVDARLARWRQVVAADARESFERRLRWQGWDLEQARGLLHDHQPVAGQAPARWTAVLAEIVAATLGCAREPARIAALEPLKDVETPLPFEDLWLPSVEVARQQLEASLRGSPAAARLHNLHPVARRALERALLKNLCERAGQVLSHELAERSLGARLFADTPPQGATHHRRFVAELRADGLQSLFDSYPALARLQAEGLQLWVAAQARFFQRLQADAPAISEHFGTAADQIISCCAGLSDPHHGNEDVQAVRFASGLELVYKPKDVEAERAFGELLAWCQCQGLAIELRAPAVLCKTGYGWVEFIETAPLADAAQLPRAFERAGALTCLLYALRATDFHVENLITAGGQLVPIDMEALLHADARPMGNEELAASNSNALFELQLGSVMRSGLLPRWTFDGPHGYDYSGIGSLHPENRYRERTWQGLGSDAMGFGAVERDLSSKPARWSLRGQPVDPAVHVEDVVRGFERCYAFLLEAQPELLADDGPLQRLRGIQQRYIFRETRIYWRILRSSFSPAALRSGIARSLTIDQLSRAYLYSKKPAGFALLAAERAAIERGDIPFFGCPSDARTISIGVERPIAGMLRASAWQSLQEQLQRLSPTDFRIQRELVRASFDVVQLRTPGSTTDPLLLAEPDAAEFLEREPLRPEECQRIGLQIADQLRDRAILGDDGSAGWIVPRIRNESDKYLLHLLPPGLYSGLEGAAVLLAGADAVRGSQANKDLVRRLFFPLFELDARETLHRRPVAGLGLNSGFGSLLYSLTLIGRLYDDASFSERVLAVVDLIDPRLIDGDSKFDLLGGSSGLLLALHALYQATGNDTLLPLALRCGERLIACQQSVEGLPAAWKTIEDCLFPLTGLSHGAAGISLSLSRLAAWSGEERFAAAAREGVAYERAVFDQEQRNWPDFRAVRGNGGRAAFMSSWCHGATGIGLARLASAGSLAADPQAQLEVDLALASSQLSFGRLDLDHICCGNFGRIELRLLAGCQRGDAEILASAYQGAAQLAGRAEQCEGFVVFKGIPGRVFDPQFFQGQAGIGYQFLRLARPELLPSVAVYAGSS